MSERKKDIIIGFIIGLILGAFFMWLNFYIQEKTLEKEKKRLEPNISINISNRDKNKVEFYLESTNSDGKEIEDFKFKFGIPGKIIDIIDLSFEMRVGVGNCEYFEKEHKFYSIIHITCESIMPKEWYNLNIDYRPVQKIYHYSEDSTATLAIPDYDLEINSLRSKGFDKIFYHSPDFNLKDFQGYSFYWLFNGNNIKKEGCKDLSEVSFIQKNNEEFVNWIEGYLYLDSLEHKVLPDYSKGSDHECYQNVECLKNIESERGCN